MKTIIKIFLVSIFSFCNTLFAQKDTEHYLGRNFDDIKEVLDFNKIPYDVMTPNDQETIIKYQKENFLAKYNTLLGFEKKTDDVATCNQIIIVMPNQTDGQKEMVEIYLTAQDLKGYEKLKKTKNLTENIVFKSLENGKHKSPHYMTIRHGNNNTTGDPTKDENYIWVCYYENIKQITKP